MKPAILTSRMLALPRSAKRAIVIALDVNICIVAALCAFYLRLGEWLTFARGPLIASLASIALVLPIFARFGFYRAIFRHVGFWSIGITAQAMFVYGLVYSMIFSSIGIAGVPRTVGFLQPMLVFILVIGSRAVAHAVFSRGPGLVALRQDRPTVLIYGAGSAGRQLASAIQHGHAMHLAGFVDDDRTIAGHTMNGIPIYASTNLASVATRRGVEEVLLAIPSATRARRAEILAQIRAVGVRVRTLPAIMDIAQGRISIGDLRELDVEDLLGRAAIAPDADLLARNVTGKIVMITGAGGSIGRELSRQIATLSPTTLILLESSEFNLYAIAQELGSITPSTPVVAILASVTDEPRVRSIVDAWRPESIYHAAAYKHVPLVEHNVIDGVRNNAIGTLVCARAARDLGVRNFTLISTDKAVRPTNVMGASKRLAEMILQSFQHEGAQTRFSMVRFGNVLESSGSVVPLFRKQIAAGGPITITHPEITRYFMTIPEAAQLVLQAGAMATGGEVFLLEMGEPVRIIDLARNMIELSGLVVRDDANPDGDIAIDIVGLRPGEKLYEELLIGDGATATPHPRILKASETFLPWRQLEPMLVRMETALRATDAAATRTILGEIVIEFQPMAPLVDHVAAGPRPAAIEDGLTLVAQAR